MEFSIVLTEKSFKDNDSLSKKGFIFGKEYRVLGVSKNKFIIHEGKEIEAILMFVVDFEKEIE